LADTATRLEQYTYDTTQYLRSQGIVVDLYDPGNEILNGILNLRPGDRIAILPGTNVVESISYLQTSVWPTEATLLTAAIHGIRRADPTARIALHIESSISPGMESAYAFFQTMQSLNVPYDVAALSLPYVDSTDLSGLTAQSYFQRWEMLVDRIAALGKPLYIAENDYPSAPVAQTFPPISDFPYSNSGQAAYVSSQLRWASNNPNIIGWTWFYPEWYPGISGNSNAPMLDVAGFFSDPQTLRPAAAALNDNLPQSLTPAVYGAPAGSGSGATFAFTFTDPKGWQDLGVVNVLFNNFLDGRQACYIAYSRPLKLLYLVNDKGDALLPGIALGGAGSVNNSQCAIAGTNSSAVGTGNTLVLRLSITFTSSFAGNKVTYLAVRDVAESNSGWQPAGVWLVSGAPDSTTAVSGAAPNWGAGHTQTLTYTFADTKGWQDLGVVNILINSALNGSQACYLAYSRPLNTLYLVNDRGNGLLPGLSLSGSGTLSNGQCSVNAAGSSAAGSGNTLTLALNVTFSASFSGYKIVYLAARDGNDANNTGWQSSACWTAE
jgi:Glycosyl hydrolase family 53